MAMIAQKSLFSWDQVDAADDLKRLEYVLGALPDEALMRHLERLRGRGRDDYPVRAMWNSVIAGIVFGHPSIESLRRELSRNPALRQRCGFDPFGGGAGVPPAWAYTRFLSGLIECQEQLEAMFHTLVESLKELLPDLGEHLAGDGKAIPSHACKRGEDKPLPRDRRGDADADLGVKTYRGRREDGSQWKKVSTWFGYELHLIVDSQYELPVAFSVTKASRSEVAEMKDNVLPQLEKAHPRLLEQCQAATFDKGYDDTSLITRLHEEHRIDPIIDIRNCWNNGKTTRSVPDHPEVQYDYQGNVECWSRCDGRRHAMAYGGYEADRKTHKYRCPARHYGMSCASEKTCPIGSGSGQVRVPLSIDPRVFTPVARPSHTWEKLYKKRSAVERVNSRIDQNLGFERHFIRGKPKMTMRVSLALIVMLAMAAGRIAHDQADDMRSLLRPAA